MINLPTIQRIIFIKETLSEYYKKVNGKDDNIFHLIELADMEEEINTKCPICGGSDCARFHKYYTRKVIDIAGVRYEDFPVARFLCRNQKLTFSLLPYQLIPYRKYSLDLIILILSLSYQNSISLVLDHLGEMGLFSITNCYLTEFSKLLKGALEKALISGYYNELNETIDHKKADKDRLVSFIGFSNGFEFVQGYAVMKGACALSYDFYLRSAGHFLFGRPSQLRYRGS